MTRQRTIFLIRRGVQSAAPAAPPRPRKANGRSRSDFETYIHADGEPLWPAERVLLNACETGATARIGEQRPTGPHEDINIRSEFLRFLLLGGDDQTPVHERGVDLQGAWIIGGLQLEACTINTPFQIRLCALGGLNIEQATLLAVNLSGSFIKRVRGDGARVRGDLFMSAGFQTNRTVSLLNARIEGDLDLQGAWLNASIGAAIIFDSARINGQVNFQNLHSRGAVRFNTAVIDGDADFAGAEIKGSRLLDVERWGFNESHGPIAICAHQARIGGRLFLLRLGECKGQFRFLYAKCAILVDDQSLISPQRSPKPGDLVLNGFIYESLYPTSPVDASTRIKWLELQPAKSLKSEFRPQPWTQIAGVLRNMGYEEAAKDIAIARERKQSQALNPGARLFHAIYGGLTRYGYRPQYIALYVLGLWLFGALVYHHAYRGDGIVPIDPSRVSRFNALAFSLDYVLPVVNLGQSKEWRINAPSEWRDQNPPKPGADPPPKQRTPREWIPGHLNAGSAARAISWIQIVFGWIAGLSLVAFLSGLARREK